MDRASLPPSLPPAVEDPKICVEAFLGGFLFSLQRIRQLCIDGFHIPAETVDMRGPLAAAQLFYQGYIALDSPNFVPIVFIPEEAPTELRRGYLLVCRVAYVSPGQPVPDLPFDEQTEKYMEKWFPRRVRESPRFKNIDYVEIVHPHDVPCE